MYLHALSKSEKENFIELAYFVAYCDNVFHEEEKNKIKEFRQEMDLSEGDYQIQNRDLESVINALSSSDKVIRRAIFLEIMDLMMSDNYYDEREHKLAEKLVIKWDVMDIRNAAVLGWIKNMYRIADVKKKS